MKNYVNKNARIFSILFTKSYHTLAFMQALYESKVFTCEHLQLEL